MSPYLYGSTLLIQLHPLDNPIWSALNSLEKNKNQGNADVAYFSPEISPFAAVSEWNGASMQKLLNGLPKDRSFSTLIAHPIQFNESWEIIFELMLFQMICTEPFFVEKNGLDIRKLSDEHIPEMLELTALTKPGPFLQRTIDFGNYHGVFENNRLVSMAGERLHLEKFTEISAVCTHPNALGKSYAAVLMSIILKQILQSGRTAFLHVRNDNMRAIKMYERLGFKHRADIFFTVFKPIQ